MKIRWFAHASFLIESSGLRIITDPYVPEVMGFSPILDPADVVIRSSADDQGHCNAGMIRGNPVVITATDLTKGPGHSHGITVTAISSKESLIHKAQPGDNAMYRFELEGVSLAHFGDVGNRLTDEQTSALSGSQVVFVPTGGPPTLDLNDLMDAIAAIRPRIIIPMHFALPGCKVEMLPLTEFTRRFPAEDVRQIEESEIELTRQTLPESAPKVVGLKASCLDIQAKARGQAVSLE